jgi:hypothetical protein
MLIRHRRSLRIRSPAPATCGCAERRIHTGSSGDSTDGDAVARLLADRKPRLMVTDPRYRIELDSEWRDRAGLNGCGAAEPSYMKKRTAGYTETTISGDTRADWSDAFALAPSLEVAYVWHASKFTRGVLDGLLRVGFLHHQQIIWDKGRTVLTPDALLVPARALLVRACGRRTRRGSARPARTPRFGLRPARSSSWEALTRKSMINRHDTHPLIPAATGPRSC